MRVGRMPARFFRILTMMTVVLAVTLTLSFAAEQKMRARVQARAIPADVSCGKCGMFPAQYPRWHTQIQYSDGVVTAFDGCKCMFNFINGMEQFDKKHVWEDVTAVLVKDFNSGEWMNASEAYYVVGSNMMGPMGKELIPFSDREAAMNFHQEQGGTMMTYGEISPEVLKSLMGGMKHHGQGKKHMKM